MSIYEAYFDAQVGRGRDSGDDISIAHAPDKYQQGCGGVGNFLGGIFRRIIPLIKKGSREVGKEAVNAGLNVVKDVAHSKVPLRKSLENRLKQSGRKLKRKAEKKLNQIFEDRSYKRLKNSRESQLLDSSESDRTDSEEEKKQLTESSKPTTISTNKKTLNKPKKKRQNKKQKKLQLRSISDIFTK